MRTDLKLDWCTHAAAKYSVEHWHYSKSLPPPPHNRVGVWEDGKFIGMVLFSRGATSNIGKPYGLKQTECCARSNGIKLVISYADPDEGHHGGIYQAGNWIYTGTTSAAVKFLVPDGKVWHSRMIKVKGFTTCYGTKRRTFKPSDCTKIHWQGKHRYLMPLCDEVRQRLDQLRQPYPKRASEV